MQLREIGYRPLNLNRGRNKAITVTLYLGQLPESSALMMAILPMISKSHWGDVYSKQAWTIIITFTITYV